jgi:hypothetical protein
MAVFTAIDDAGSYFNTLLWTGNSTNSTAITGVGFQPDMVWIKNRSTTDNHAIFDAIRGATYRIYPNDTDAQIQATNSLASFDSDGFTLNDGGDANGVGEDIVGWNWKANGAGSSNTDGSITSTVSANTTTGFSIVSYTGTGSAATIGHGLGVAPNFIITKSLVATQEWCVYHKSLGATKHLFLDENSAVATSSAYWNDVEPDSSVFTIGTAGPTNSSSAMIAYCFAEKQGFSKFGMYTGNGEENADGAFNYTGFRPGYLMIKRTDGIESWIMLDNKRDPYNPAINYLLANVTNAEATGTDIDFCANGFKCRSMSQNENTYEYVYFAFAESPFVNSEGVPTNPR